MNIGMDNVRRGYGKIFAELDGFVHDGMGLMGFTNYVVLYGIVISFGY